jgi:hypothetical protein
VPQKGRDVASFAGVLEALTGQTLRIRTFIVRRAFFGVFLKHCFVIEVGCRVTIWRSAINFNGLR